MIHESAYVEEGSEIGDNTNIWHFVHVRKNAKIGKNCNIGKGVYVDINVKIGDNCKIQNFVSLYNGLTLEDDVFIGPHVCFTNDIYPRSKIWSDEKVTKTLVKKGCSIGANSTIIAGVTIGRNAMVGAGSLVSKDVPDYGLFYGHPAVLKGFVCECGSKLKKTGEEQDKVVLKCEKCGKKIRIDEKIYRGIE